MSKKISIEAMMEAGMHFGHQTFRRNPKMDPYIFDARDGIHIIDLTKTEPLLVRALDFAKGLAEEGKQIIFVGTKKQAGPLVKEFAEKCGMPFVDQRWMGGLLTNYETLKKRLKYMREIDERFAKNNFGDMTKKERADLDKVYKALQVSLGGLRELKGLPSAIFVVSTLQDDIAVREATKLKLPVIAMVDTNSDPTKIAYPIPSNDDAKKAIAYVLEMMAEACKDSHKPQEDNHQTPSINNQTKSADSNKEDQSVEEVESTSTEDELKVKVEEGTNGN